MFSITHKIFPSAKCIKSANWVSRDIDILRKPINVLNKVLYSLTLSAHKTLDPVSVLEISLNLQKF
jgi:hypothetical protein